ncbi:amidohydrolase family protein [Rhodococcus sp. IEGM 1379]|uniref:amidohydrolase family protein n=1 Tax=Rhodococcus sp. IEGM 1379 TaxID=3047086 RepID=UPI0024B699A8|nr:amidohydrolase family protein [Rhodococcus sp. IEGM 1379]MDI9915042.1 amidohydrolase family protein [Rhodococcus sp. IEGM 1379]
MTVPDCVFVNGAIQTMSEEQETTTLPTAMACEAGIFTAVGSDAEVLALAGPATESVVEALAARAEQTPADTLVEAWGFDDSLVAEDRRLTVIDLDRASTRHPIMVRHTSNHGIYLNSVALAEAGINTDTPAPGGGVIVRFTDGTPTGELREIPAKRIEPGLRADFVVLDADPLADESHSEGPADLSAIGVLRTVVGGDTVYQA